MSASLDAQLREYTEYFDEQLTEVAAEDVMTERVSEGPVQPLRPRYPVVRRGWLVAAGAAVVVAFIVGLVGLLLTSETDSAPPATDPLPKLEEVAPQLRSSGLIDTPMGRVRWSYLTGPSGPGSALFEAPNGELAMWLTDEGLLWTSSDGAEWEAAPLLMPVAAETSTLRVVGGAFWLATSNPTTLWHTADLREWSQIDLSELPLPDTFNVGWDVRLTAVAETGSGVALAYTASPRPPLESWFPEIAETHSNLHLDLFGLDPDAAYPVRGTRKADGLDETVAMISLRRFGENGSAWRVYNAEGGWEVGYFSFDAGEEVVVDPFGYSIGGLALVDGDGRVESVTPPWLNRSVAIGGLAHTDGRLLSVAGTDVGAGGTELWASDDGREWVSLGRPPFMEPGITNAHIWEEEGVVYGSSESDASSFLWTLVDGSTWAPLPRPTNVAQEAVRPFGPGFAAATSGGVLFSADGSRWEEVPYADLEIGIDGVVSAGRVGGRIAVRAWPGDQPGGAAPGIQILLLELGA